ncbi:MAG: tRNA dihydrouridine synthase DusB [Elusimicrobia bacterium]|nr:tRNA dihydrouridine synthase DusB [Elusimicrobiota bacterium]
MQIGDLSLQKPLILAPMENVTDLSFRLVAKGLGADVTMTEFTAAEALIRQIKKALKKARISDEERPAGIQIFGSRPQSMAEAARVVESLRPDFIDINAGCWVKNHCARFEGAGLLKDLPLFESIVRATVEATHLPVTVKTRLGWDEKSIVILEAAKMVEAAGAKMLTVHCRTRAQGYKGRADWSWLEKVRKAVSIPLIGNGDVVSPQDAKALFDIGCDGVMIGRGATANPWIFREIKHFLKTGSPLPEPSLAERTALAVEHLRSVCAHKECRNPVLTFRKHYAGYFRNVPSFRPARMGLMKIETLEGAVERLQRFLMENPEKA